MVNQFPVRLRRLLGDVPIYSPFYAATEGLLGVNIAPDQAEDSSMQVYDGLCKSAFTVAAG